MIYAYMRVSTERQEIEIQRDVINEYCEKNDLKVDAWFKDIETGKTVTTRRKEFANILKLIQKGDTIIIRDLSRLGRSLRDIINTCFEFKQKGIEIIAIKENINSKTNRMMFTMLVTIYGLFAEIERILISERTKDALRGKENLGRPSKILKRTVSRKMFNQRIAELCNEGLKPTEIATEIGISLATVYRHLPRKEEK